MNKHNLRRVKIQILKGARAHLRSSRPLYMEGLCSAVFFCTPPTPVGRQAAEELNGYIGRALGGHSYLFDWQTAHGISRTVEQLKQDRIDWAQWMIDRLEEQP